MECSHLSLNLVRQKMKTSIMLLSYQALPTKSYGTSVKSYCMSIDIDSNISTCTFLLSKSN